MRILAARWLLGRCPVWVAIVTLYLPWVVLAQANSSQVRLLSCGKNSFELVSGDYRLRYDNEADKDGWITVLRDGCEAGLATRLANGEHLDVTASRASEVNVYHWPDDVRKDSRMFKSLSAHETPQAIEVTILSERSWAKFESKILAYKGYPGLLRWTVRATAKLDTALSGKVEPDCLFIASGKGPTGFGGAASHEVVRYSVQRGPGLPHVFFRSLPMKSYVFYFEDLSSLNDLYRLTGCATPYDYLSSGNPGAVRMGEPQAWFQMSSSDGNHVQPMKPWAEKTERYTRFGYERPTLLRVPQGKSLVLGDTYLYLKPANLTDTVTVSRSFCEMLADIFQFIYKPPQIETDWAGEIVPKLVKDVMRPENTSRLQGGHLIPRAYVAFEHEDGQLWTVLQLLHPLELYVRRFPKEKDAAELRRRLDDALPAFFDKEWGGFINNPAPINQEVFLSSVYVFTPLVMVADLARLGNANARAMLLGYRDRLLQMGKACNYVMAEIWLKDFTRQRGLYQGDSTCCYLYAIMALYDLSGGKDTECLAAAKCAAAKLRERCLDLGWEAHMTAVGIVACEQLYRATGDASYHELAYIPLAGILREAWLWQCDYGVGEFTTTFWSFCCCPGAPCSAEFEASRVRLHFKHYAAMTAGAVSTNLTTMLNDAWQRGPTQSRFALPPLLAGTGAKRFLARVGKSETNCGEIRYDQMIPLEDVSVGWGTDFEWWQNNAKLGVVGQEIYGAGGPIWYAVWQAETGAAN